MTIPDPPPTPRTLNGDDPHKAPKLGDFSQLIKSSRTWSSLSPQGINCKTGCPSSTSGASAKRHYKLLDLDTPAFARLLVHPPARNEEPGQSCHTTLDPPSPSPAIVGSVLLSGSAPIRQRHVDPYTSATDDDTHVEDYSDEFNDATSHTSTPATSPATSINHRVDDVPKIVSTVLIESPLKKAAVVSSRQSKQANAPAPIPADRKSFLQQLNNSPRSWAQLQRRERLRVADVLAAAGMAERVTVPWDMDGNFLKPRPSDTRDIPPPRDTIEPLYRLAQQTKLQILKAAMKNTYDEDARIRAHPWSQAVTNEPIHVYVDLSNIIIGFYNHLKSRRNMPPDSRTRAPPFSFHAFAAAVERGRPSAKRAIAGSVRQGMSVPAYMLEAEGLGYQMNILQRVRGTKKSVPNLFLDQMMTALVSMNNPYAPPPYANAASDSEDGGYQRGQPGWREQAVDEILHLKMMQSLLDTEKPATIVLCTGDAAEAEFSDGFLRNVERALARGWYVEVVGWRDTMADAWFEKGFRKKHGWRFRTIVLDGMVEELLAVYA